MKVIMNNECFWSGTETWRAVTEVVVVRKWLFGVILKWMLTQRTQEPGWVWIHHHGWLTIKDTPSICEVKCFGAAYCQLTLKNLALTQILCHSRLFQVVCVLELEEISQTHSRGQRLVLDKGSVFSWISLVITLEAIWTIKVFWII